MEIDKPFNTDEAIDRVQEIFVDVTSSPKLSDVAKTLTVLKNYLSDIHKKGKVIGFKEGHANGFEDGFKKGLKTEGLKL
jgi:hypothetical protein